MFGLPWAPAAIVCLFMCMYVHTLNVTYFVFDDRLAEKKVAKRIEVTKNSSVDLPRLEVLSSRLGLDYFERTLIILLIGKVCDFP